MPGPPHSLDDFKTYTDEVKPKSSSSSKPKSSCFSGLCFGSRNSSSKTPLKSNESRERLVDESFRSGRGSTSTEYNVEDDWSEAARTRNSAQVTRIPQGSFGRLRLIEGVPYTQRKPNRPINEDAYLFESRELRDGSRVTLVGVFDGHVNEQLSHWLSENYSSVFFAVLSILKQSFGLPNCLTYLKKLFPSSESFAVRSQRLLHLNCPDFVTLSLCVSFAICDEKAMALGNVDTANSGSCASIVAVTDSGVFMATLGDSSAALIASCEGQTRTLFKTSDHRTITRPDEVDRIVSAGGKVHKGRSIGMAFSSISVTRSLGDTIWRANDDWKRDKTREPNSKNPVIDKDLLEFSRMKGCVGVCSDPEWYSCRFITDEDSITTRINLESNSPDRVFRKHEEVATNNCRFFLVVGSDGFWETSGLSSLLECLAGPTGYQIDSHGLIQVAKDAIGPAPHDDSTVVVAQLVLRHDNRSNDRDGLESEQMRQSEPAQDDDAGRGRGRRGSCKRRSQSDHHDTNTAGGHLDYLFS